MDKAGKRDGMSAESRWQGRQAHAHARGKGTRTQMPLLGKGKGLVVEAVVLDATCRAQAFLRWKRTR